MEPKSWNWNRKTIGAGVALGVYIFHRMEKAEARKMATQAPPPASMGPSESGFTKGMRIAQELFGPPEKPPEPSLPLVKPSPSAGTQRSNPSLGASGDRIKCPHCGGKGTVLGPAGPMTVTPFFNPCPVCKGSGKL